MTAVAFSGSDEVNIGLFDLRDDAENNKIDLGDAEAILGDAIAESLHHPPKTIA